MKRLGTKARLSPIEGSPPLGSRRRTGCSGASKAYVTSGTVLRALLSSPMGNMTITLLINTPCGQFMQNGATVCTHTACRLSVDENAAAIIGVTWMSGSTVR